MRGAAIDIDYDYSEEEALDPVPTPDIMAMWVADVLRPDPLALRFGFAATPHDDAYLQALKDRQPSSLVQHASQYAL